MKKLFFIALFITFKFSVNATIVYASKFGWNASDVTSSFQAAINSTVDTIIIDKQSSDWIVGPNLFNGLHDKTIIFQMGVVLQAKPGAFPGTTDCLFELDRASNVKIFGYGATFQMHKAEYAALANKGEWRASLTLNNSSNIEVYGLKLNESGGDGVYITGEPYSENILLKDIWCDNQYRQGISVISAQHLLVQNCWFTNTSGTLPECGVDIEPNKSSDRIVDVVFKNCRFTGNFGSGIAVGPGNLNSTSIPVDISFVDCYLSGNHDVSNAYSACEINIGAERNDAVTGNVKFVRCLVENSQWTVVSMRKPANSFFASFDDCVFLNVSQLKGKTYNSPIWIEITDYSIPCPRFGGIAFNNCLLSYKTNYNFLGSYGNIDTSPGMGNVQLKNLVIFNPYSSVTLNVTSGGGSPDATCKFDFHKFVETPETNVSLISDHDLTESIHKEFSIQGTRASCKLNFPIGMTYNITGTAVQGIDMNLMNGFLIIPKDLHSRTETSHFLVRKDFIAKDFDVAVNPSTLFSISPSAIDTTIILDCGTTGIENLPNEKIFDILPNPTNDLLRIVLADDYLGTIQVINESGQLVISKKLQGKENSVRMNGLTKGIYFVRIQIENEVFSKKIAYN